MKDSAEGAAVLERDFAGASGERASEEKADAGRPVAVKLEGIVKAYDGKPAVKGVSLTIFEHEFVSLLGPSGCGKSTILKMIGGFEEPDQGSIEVMGKPMMGKAPNHRPVNTVFQSYALFPHMPVLQNVTFPLEVAKVPKGERRERAMEALELVHLTAHVDNPAEKLSGGQAQRVALARALVGRPDVLLLDEPLSALDLKLRQAMQVELRRIHEQTGTTFIFVTHDQGEALAMSDRIVLLNSGKVEQIGLPHELYDTPRTSFVSDFIGSANMIEAVVASVADEAVTVVCSGMRTTAAADGRHFTVGDIVDVSIRPERITVCAPGAGAQVTGQVEMTSFHGNYCRTEVNVGAFSLAVEEQGTSAEMREIDTTVGLTWAPGAARVYPRSQA